MSKPYRIQVQELIQVEDYSTFQIDQLPLLPQDRFAELIAAVLQAAGWQEGPDGLLTLDTETSETYTYDPETLQIRTTLTGSQEVEKDIEAWDSNSLEEQAQDYIDRQTQLLEETVSSQLAERHQERVEQFEAWVTEATGQALKEIAEQLGDVQNIDEHRGEDGSYRLTISIQEYE